MSDAESKNIKDKFVHFKRIDYFCVVKLLKEIK